MSFILLSLEEMEPHMHNASIFVNIIVQACKNVATIKEKKHVMMILKEKKNRTDQR